MTPWIEKMVEDYPGHIRSILELCHRVADRAEKEERARITCAISNYKIRCKLKGMNAESDAAELILDMIWTIEAGE